MSFGIPLILSLRELPREVASLFAQWAASFGTNKVCKLTTFMLMFCQWFGFSKKYAPKQQSKIKIEGIPPFFLNFYILRTICWFNLWYSDSNFLTIRVPFTFLTQDSYLDSLKNKYSNPNNYSNLYF